VIHFSFFLWSPWKWTGLIERPSVDYIEGDWKVTENKCASLQITRWNRDYPWIIGLEFDLSWRGQSHAGFLLDLTLLDHSVILNVYDRRHWDDKNDKWEAYEDV
jgi:hypothetical protein